MNAINLALSVISIAAPLLLITTGALVSEYGGRLAMFVECIINLGAFFCYAYSAALNSAFAGALLSVLTCTAIVLGLERLASRFKANMFLVSLAMNLLFASLATFFSSTIFGTRGVLYSASYQFSPSTMKLVTSIICYAAVALIIMGLRYTKWGLAMRITGSDSQVLSSQGISADFYRCISWITAAACGAFGGCVLSLRLSSYVPGMASGRGWTALAAVYLGRKNPPAVVLAVFVFAFAEYGSSHIHNIPLLSGIPSSVLLAFPYLMALLLILIVPKEK